MALLNRGVDVNKANNRKCSALHYASSKQHIDLVRILLENDAKVNVSDVRRETPLHRASIGSNTQIIRLLLENDADINAKNKYFLNLTCLIRVY